MNIDERPKLSIATITVPNAANTLVTLFKPIEVAMQVHFSSLSQSYNTISHLSRVALGPALSPSLLDLHQSIDGLQQRLVLPHILLHAQHLPRTRRVDRGQRTREGRGVLQRRQPVFERWALRQQPLDRVRPQDRAGARDDEPLLAHVRARGELGQLEREDVRARDVAHVAVVGGQLEGERAARLARDELVDERVRAEAREPAWGQTC